MLRQERIERGWSQQYVAREVGVSRVAIHQMETGITKPSYDVLVKLLDLFNYSDPRPLSMAFFRQKYWRGLPFPPPGDFPDPGIESLSLMSPTLARRFLPLAPPGKPTPGRVLY